MKSGWRDSSVVRALYYCRVPVFSLRTNRVASDSVFLVLEDPPPFSGFCGHFMHLARINIQIIKTYIHGN